MRLVQRNLQTVYYAEPTGVTMNTDADGRYTGGKTIQYSEPTEARMNVAPALRSTSLEPYGIHEVYTHVLITDDMETDFNTSMVFWIRKTPEDGAYNFICVRVARQLPTSGAVRLFVREVSNS